MELAGRVAIVTGASLRGRAELLVRLVVAVHDQPLARDAGALSEAQLA